MKINRGIYYVLILVGGGFLFLASSIAPEELGLAIGFVLIMAGLYGLSRTNRPPEGAPDSRKDEDN